MEVTTKWKLEWGRTVIYLVRCKGNPAAELKKHDKHQCQWRNGINWKNVKSYIQLMENKRIYMRNVSYLLFRFTMFGFKRALFLHHRFLFGICQPHKKNWKKLQLASKITFAKVNIHFRAHWLFTGTKRISVPETWTF